MLLNQPMQTLVPTSSVTSQPSQCNMGISQTLWVIRWHRHVACSSVMPPLRLNPSLHPSTQIHLGAADHRPLVLHAAGQLQRRPRPLSGLHVPYNDPTQQLHLAPVAVSLPRSASGLSALPAAPAAPAVLSGTTPLWWCSSVSQRLINSCP